ncbi:Flocculation suppression protein [Aspergillus sp. HF37]|nr:Flocculation suppression protein [Aspergillus sp. HF37]
MSGVAQPPKGSFPPSADGGPGRTRRNLPVLSSSGQSSSEPMDVTPPASTASAQPPAHSSPDSDRANTNGTSEPTIPNNAPNQVVGAAAAAQQPKVVQTAFIHKLYKYAGQYSRAV